MAKVIVKEKNIEIAQEMKIASGFFDKLIGLMFRSKMNGFDCLLIKHCKSIHTCFMRYPIDVIFVNKKFEVIKIIEQMKPWRFTRLFFTAAHVFELYGGSVENKVKVGDKLEVVCIK